MMVKRFQYAFGLLFMILAVIGLAEFIRLKPEVPGPTIAIGGIFIAAMYGSVCMVAASIGEPSKEDAGD